MRPLNPLNGIFLLCLYHLMVNSSYNSVRLMISQLIAKIYEL